MTEDDKDKPTTIRIEGDNLVYYMTLEENQKLLESYRDKTGQDLSKEYGEEASKKEVRDDKKEDKDEWESSPFD